MTPKKKKIKTHVSKAMLQEELTEELNCEKSVIMFAVPQNSPCPPITVNGNNNRINIINGAISDNRFDNVPKIDAPDDGEPNGKKSGIKGFFLGILQSLITKIILWILGGIGTVILGYLALK